MKGTVRCLDRLYDRSSLVSPMDPIHNAAAKNDVAFIQASDVVDAIIFLLARSGGGSLGTPPRLYRDDVAARCRNSTRRAATLMHAIRTPLPNPIFPF